MCVNVTTERQRNLSNRCSAIYVQRGTILTHVFEEIVDKWIPSRPRGDFGIDKVAVKSRL